jgi:glycosyltransferase involved in cell wall biosynthesis
VLAANTATAQFLRRNFAVPVELFTGVAMNGVVVPVAPETKRSGPTRLLWVGALQPLKGLPLLLEALSVAGKDVTLTVVGSGPELRRSQRLVAQAGLRDSVQFLGQLPHSELQRLYPETDIFVFTSLRDTSGNVLLEAMAAGLPVIALDWAGPHDLLSQDCAVKIPPLSRKQVVDDLATAVGRLAGDPGLRRRMGKAGRQRIADAFGWDRKAEEIGPIYQKAVSKGRCP